MFPFVAIPLNNVFAANPQILIELHLLLVLEESVLYFYRHLYKRETALILSCLVKRLPLAASLYIVIIA